MRSIEESTIRELLEKYFEGGTDSSEEKLLREYFTGNESIPEDLEYASAMFGFFSDAAEITSQRQFILPVAGISGNEDKNRENIPPLTIPKKSIYPRSFAYAASVAALIGLTVIFSLTLKNQPQQEEVIYCYVNGEPVTDYQTALNYTTQAMDLVAENLRKPVEYLAPISKISQPIEILKSLTQPLSEE